MPTDACWASTARPIPNAIGYQEKEYFSPGDTGFRVWDTAHGRLGVGICWDQWFPETARCLALQGAEVLLFPTAIGSEPGAQGLDSRDHWQMTMRGHAAANLLPVVAANRVGREVATTDPELQMSFYGSSFICDHKGTLLAVADREGTTVLLRRWTSTPWPRNASPGVSAATAARRCTARCSASMASAPVTWQNTRGA